MAYRAHIKNGVAVLDEPADLPDGTPVRVEVERLDPAFWQNQSVADLARAQGVAAVQSLDELAGDWPPEDSVEEFLAAVRAGRR